MPLPDLQSDPAFDGQAIQDATDLSTTAATANSTGVISGCAVTAATGMTVNIASGAIQSAGTGASVAAQSVTLANASSSDRRDIIVANGAGIATAITGTPCGTAGWSRTSPGLPPVKPSVPDGSVFLADIYVASTTTAITSANIEVNTTQLNASPVLFTVLPGNDGLDIRFLNGCTTEQALQIFDQYGSPIFSVPTAGGPKVYGDMIGAVFGVFGEEIALDGNTNPPSFLLPSGSRIWEGAGAPSSVIQTGTVSVNDQYYNSASGLWMSASVGGTPGTWIVSGFNQLQTLFAQAGQLIVGTGAGTAEFLAAGSVGTVLTSNGPTSIPSWQVPTGGGGASAGVSSFNTRFGAVTLGAADVETTFGAAGQLFMGTGSGAGELLAPSSQAGLVLTSAGTGANLVWQSASVASGVSTVTATDYSQAITQSNASVNVHAGIGVFVDALGADPTGATDSTAAFNAALQAVAAASVGYVRLGVGTYLIGTDVTTTTTTTGNVSASCPATFKMASTTGWFNGYGTFEVVTSNGNAVVFYNGISGASVTGCSYANLGGTGSITSGASVTVGVGTFTHNQGIIGPGSELTTLNYQGPGVAIWMADRIYAASVSKAGPAGGFSITGTSSGLAGFIFGNLDYARCDDIASSGFTNANSGSGFYLKPLSGANYGSWTRCIANNNDVGVLIGGAHNYSEYDFTIVANANQDGVVVFSNAGLVGCHLRVRGQFNTGVSSNTGVAWQVGSSSSDTTTITNSTYDFSVASSGTGVAHQSLLVNVSLSGLAQGVFGTGMVSFQPLSGATAFANSSLSGSFAVSGYINVPGIGLMSLDAFGVTGGSLWRTAGGATTALPSIYFLNAGDLQMYQLASGANSFAWGFPPSSSNFFGKQITVYVVQPSSGGAGTLTWPGNVVWASGSAPVLSAANNAADAFHLTFMPQTNTWYGSYGAGSASDRGGRVLPLSSNSATPSINTDSYSTVHITGQSAGITSFTTNLQGHPQDGNELRISVTGTTSVALAWGAAFEPSTVALPTTTSGTNRIDVAFVYNTETSKWRCVGAA